MKEENTKEALLEALKEVFGDSDDPAKMTVLIRRVPILCTNIEAMHRSIEEMKDNQKWVVRIIIGAVVAALLKLVLVP